MTDSLPKSSGNEKRSCKKISKLIHNITIAPFPLSIKESGLADHLPVFAVRSYKGKERPHARGKPCKITYRNM